MRLPLRACAVLCVVLSAPIAYAGQAGGPDAFPPSQFADPQRRAKLATAFPKIELAFRRFAEQQRVPGIVFGVVVDGELAFSGAFGLRDVEANAPADLDTVFRIASMTKSFTALAILKLRDEGRLSLDDPAARWVPELASLEYPTRDSAPITIRQLLTHSAGFPEDNPWGDRQLAQSPGLFARGVAAGIPFSTAPNTAFEYSNYGFALLGRVVAQASGRAYREYVDTEILKPLGLTASRWEASAVPPEHLAQGYRREGDRLVREEPLAGGPFEAMGGLSMSGRDLARYVAFHLDAWPPRNDPDPGPVRRSSRREMQQVQRYVSLSTWRTNPDSPLRATAGGYGYGLGVGQSCVFQRQVSHSGGLPGFGSRMVWLPQHGIGLFALANLTYAGLGDPSREALDALAATGGLVPRVPQPSAALTRAVDAVSSLFAEWDDARARRIAADNLLLDQPLEQRRAELARIRAEQGACRREGELEPQNALRGRFRMRCDRGAVDVWLTLAPTSPPLVQLLELTPVLPLSAGLQNAADGLLQLAQSWDASRAAGLVDASVDTAKVRDQLVALQAGYGPCHRGETLSGDGVKAARVRLDCARGAIEVSLAAAGGGGRIAAPSFSSPADATCVP